MVDQILRLEGVQRVRRRPAVVFGTEDARGAHKAIEMLAELLAEEAAAQGGSLTLTLLRDDTVVLRADGRGIYFGEGDRLWQELFTRLYAADAYTAPEKRNIFDLPTGREPDGSNLELYAATCVCAHMHILSHRDGYAYALRFENGENVGGLQKEPCLGETGTQIVYRPDPLVFTDTALSPERLSEMLRALEQKYPGLKTAFRRETQ